MLAVPIGDAQPGMRLAIDLCHPDHPEQDLLKCGYELEPAIIERLRELGIPALYVDYPGLDDLDRHLAVHLSGPRRTLYNQVKATVASVQKTARPTVGFADYYACIRELIVTLLHDGKHPQYVELISANMGADAIRHAAAVAHLALALGIKLERYLIDQRDRLPPSHAREVVNLGVAGMLHDIGKANFPEILQRRSSIDPPLTEDQQSEWESHPRLAYEMIRGGVESSAAAAVMHHHQHFDGSGFPVGRDKDGATRRRAGERIHVFARIIQAADLYDRLAVPRDRGLPRRPVEVLHLIRTQYSNRLDPHVVQTMPLVIPPFPPGERVTLSDGSAAMVTAINSDAPYHPMVRRLAEDGWALTGEAIDLTEASAPTIASIGDLDVTEMVPATKRT